MSSFNSHTHCQVAQADPRAKTWQRVCPSNSTSEPTDNQADKKEQRRHNSTYNKLAVQWLNEALYFVLNFLAADSFRLLNRQLLAAANR